MIVVDPSHIPGLDLYTNRTNQQYNAQQYGNQSVTNQPYVQSTVRHDGQPSSHEPYQEGRVLTPSRFRHPSKPYSDPESPRREFGTQTGKAVEIDTASSLNGVYISIPELTCLLINCSYKFTPGMEVVGKKVLKGCF